MNSLRRHMMMQQGGGGLPTYLQETKRTIANGNQWFRFDANIPSGGFSYYVKSIADKTQVSGALGNGSNIFGQCKYDGSYLYFNNFLLNFNTNYFRVSYVNSEIEWEANIENNIPIYSVKKDGVVVISGVGNRLNGYSGYIYVFWNNAHSRLSGSLFNFFVHEYIFISCVSIDETTNQHGENVPIGTAGFYDLSTKTFYTNDGTGKFGYETMGGVVVSPE